MEAMVAYVYVGFACDSLAGIENIEKGRKSEGKRGSARAEDLYLNIQAEDSSASDSAEYVCSARRMAPNKEREV